ncbi:hypothetical protein AAFF_G00376750 [Aldrovandia affinis]|uniref:Uncharacterized protein n=1 Tax=Aldrovandia affinis TaxID=143900 RepID=A0AAD7SFU3_9TELE|nr:hypothetical protein AAFF_G00376750 [Aldrovandia affinis]
MTVPVCDGYDSRLSSSAQTLGTEMLQAHTPKPFIPDVTRNTVAFLDEHFPPAFALALLDGLPGCLALLLLCPRPPDFYISAFVQKIACVLVVLLPKNVGKPEFGLLVAGAKWQHHSNPTPEGGGSTECSEHHSVGTVVSSQRNNRKQATANCSFDRLISNA